MVDKNAKVFCVMKVPQKENLVKNNVYIHSWIENGNVEFATSIYIYILWLFSCISGNWIW